MAAEESESQEESRGNVLWWSLVGTSTVASLLLLAAYKSGVVTIQVQTDSALKKIGSSVLEAGSTILSKLTDASVLAGIAGSSVATTIGCWYQERERDRQRQIEVHVHERQQEQQATVLTCRAAEAHAEKAITYYKKGKYDKAQQSLSLAIETFNEMQNENASELIEQTVLKLKYYKAKCLLHNMRLDECVVLLEEILTEKEDYVGALNLRGLVFFLQQDFARAREVFYRSLSCNNRQNIIDKLIQCCDLQLETSISLCFGETDSSDDDRQDIVENKILAESILRTIEVAKATSFFTPVLLDLYVQLHLILRDNTRSSDIAAMTKRMQHHINAIAFAELFIHLYDKDIRFKPVVSKMFGHLAKLYASLYGSGASSSSLAKTAAQQKTAVVQIPSFIDGVETKEITPQEARDLSGEYQQQKEIIDNEMVYTSQKILKA